jgi:hypothetical protein
MIDLKSMAEGILHDYLVRQANDLVSYDIMEDDPEAALLSDQDYESVAHMIANARVAVKVTIL